MQSITIPSILNEAYAPFPLDLTRTSLGLKVRSKNMTSTQSLLSSPEPGWQRTWQGLKTEVVSLKHRPSHRYLEMGQECRTFKSVACGLCDWMLSDLAMRAPLTKIDGKVDDW